MVCLANIVSSDANRQLLPIFCCRINSCTTSSTSFAVLCVPIIKKHSSNLPKSRWQHKEGSSNVGHWSDNDLSIPRYSSVMQECILCSVNMVGPWGFVQASKTKLFVLMRHPIILERSSWLASFRCYLQFSNFYRISYWVGQSLLKATL